MRSEQANFQVYIRLRPLSNQQTAQMSYFQTNYLKKTSSNSSGTPTKASMCKLSQNAYNYVSKFYNCDINNIIKVEENTLYVVDSEYKSIDRKYRPHRFNGIFSERMSNVEVYEKSVHTQVDKLLQGYNSTIFTYGITGSGKTYTVFGGCLREEEKGICYLAYEYLLLKKEEMERNSDCKVFLNFSFFEIYNENVRDLLSPQPINQTKSLSVIEDTKGNTIIQDLIQKPIHNLSEIYQLLGHGCSKRALASTNSNLYSSRSHALQQLTVQVSQGDEIKTIGRLFIIDLAGSQKMSSNTPKGITEGANINKSLLALGNCINILSQKKSSTAPINQHIPYRDSKLTRILKDSLGGNTSTLMIACISSNPFTLEQTMTTLNYASRANGIQRKISKNSVSFQPKMDDGAIRRQLDSLRQTLSKPISCIKCGHNEQSFMQIADQISSNNLQEITLRLEEIHNRKIDSKVDHSSIINDICEDIVKITSERQQIIGHLNSVGQNESLGQKLKEALKINKQQLDEYKDILVRHATKMKAREDNLLRTIEKLAEQNKHLLTLQRPTFQNYMEQENLQKYESAEKSKEKRRTSNKFERVRMPSMELRTPLNNWSSSSNRL